MSDIITYPENGITYDADDASGYLATRQSGVYSAEEDFAVTPAGELSLTVSAGQAWVRPSRFKGRSIIMEQPTTLTLTAADPVRTRIDRVVLRYDAAARQTRLQVLEGTPDSASPTAPAITRTALVYDLCLAEITRPAGSTAITAADLTDTRADEDVCGVMRDGVTGIPTAQLIAQWRAAQAAQVAAGQALLDQLREEIKDGSAYSKTEADTLFALTADKITAALGYDPTAKITRLERIIGMDGKLVFSGAGVCTGGTTTMTIPSTVDYVEIVSAIPAMGRNNRGYTDGADYMVAIGTTLGVSADFGHAKVARGGSAAVAFTGLATSGNNVLGRDFPEKSIHFNNESADVSLVSVSFASGGTLSISGGSSANRFTVYGYQYL
nr:MAG TPA: Receptor Binding Protein [Caudoviricetes sp.]